MKKIFNILLVFVLVLFLTGCGNQKSQKPQMVFNTKYSKINDYLNEMVSECDLEDETFSVVKESVTQGVIYVPVSHAASKSHFMFEFDANEEFKEIIVSYGINYEYVNSIIDKMLKYSKFELSSDEIDEINNIINGSNNKKANNEKRIGKYKISNLVNHSFIMEVISEN